VKDLGYLFRDEPALAGVAAAIAAKACDVTELLAAAGLPDARAGEAGPGAATPDLRVAYHSACSMQHGQRLHEQPRRLLRDAGFDVVEIPESHLCCGSAGTYNMLQPALAARLAARKLTNIAATGANVVAAGNLGCLTQLGTAARERDAGDRPRVAFVHTVELLDWATGGPRPAALDS
jgi:glycolate oxidase iron-sulfur subunit